MRKAPIVDALHVYCSSKQEEAPGRSSPEAPATAMHGTLPPPLGYLSYVPTTRVTKNLQGPAVPGLGSAWGGTAQGGLT